MSILGEIGAAGTVLKGASSLLQQLKPQQKSSENFESLFRAHLEMHHASPEKQLADAGGKFDLISETVIRRHDSNGDGLLSMEESGFGAEVFNRYDLDGDGLLSAAEVRQYVMDAFMK
jgi:hypothetical protein